jgi:hypothetical protein
MKSRKLLVDKEKILTKIPNEVVVSQSVVKPTEAAATKSTFNRIDEQGKFCDLGGHEAIIDKIMSLGVLRVLYYEREYLDVAAKLLEYAWYGVINESLRGYPEYPGWVDWNHVGIHNRIGHAYWNYLHFKHPGSTIHFSDQPDFKGFLGEKNIPFEGDVNQVGCSTFVRTFQFMPRHSLWITVTEGCQILIEPLIDMAKLTRLCLFGCKNGRLTDEDIKILVDDPEPDEQQWKNRYGKRE